jgi:hypothetical protein
LARAIAAKKDVKQMQNKGYLYIHFHTIFMMFENECNNNNNMFLYCEQLYTHGYRIWSFKSAVVISLPKISHHPVNDHL